MNTVTDAIVAAVRKLAGELDEKRYCEVMVQVQDGKVTVVEVTAKYKP